MSAVTPSAAPEAHLCIFTSINNPEKKSKENQPTIDAAAADHLVLEQREEEEEGEEEGMSN